MEVLRVVLYDKHLDLKPMERGWLSKRCSTSSSLKQHTVVPSVNLSPDQRVNELQTSLSLNVCCTVQSIISASKRGLCRVQTKKEYKGQQGCNPMSIYLFLLLKYLVLNSFYYHCIQRF